MKKHFSKSFSFSLAEFIIRIDFEEKVELTPPAVKKQLQRKIYNYCRNFILTTNPKKIDFVITIVDPLKEDLIVMRQQKKYYLKIYEEIQKNKIRTNYFLNMMGFQLMLQKILYYLLLGSGFMLHCSASRVANQAEIFIGPQESGKTTTINLLRSQFAPLGDDTGVIRFIRSRFYYFQTPFGEKEWRITKFPKPYLINRIFVLKKKQPFKIVRLTNYDKNLKKLARQLLATPEAVKKQMKLLMKFAKIHPLFKLSYQKSTDKDLLLRYLRKE